MTKFFDIDAANRALEEVAPLLATLADQRAELIRLRDRTLAAHASATGGGPDLEPEEAQRIRLRMRCASSGSRSGPPPVADACAASVRSDRKSVV